MNTIYSPDGANGYTLNLDDGSKQTIENIIEEWLINYSKEIEKELVNIQKLLEIDII